MRKVGILVAALSTIAVATPVLAHHGFDTEYDASKHVKLEGVVTMVTWTNPHMRVYVDVTGADGKVTTWNLELGSPNSVLRRGWTKNDIKVGDKITFKGFAGRVVTTRAVADAITLADGRAFTGASGAPGQIPGQ